MTPARGRNTFLCAVRAGSSKAALTGAIGLLRVGGFGHRPTRPLSGPDRRSVANSSQRRSGFLMCVLSRVNY